MKDFIKIMYNYCLKSLKYFDNHKVINNINYIFNNGTEYDSQIKIYKKNGIEQLKKFLINDVEYSLKPLLFELHDYYKYSNQKITFKIVNDYVFHLPGKKILFIQKYL